MFWMCAKPESIFIIFSIILEFKRINSRDLGLLYYYSNLLTRNILETYTETQTDRQIIHSHTLSVVVFVCREVSNVKKKPNDVNVHKVSILL
jgi:uncharacterized protein YbcV (DUF1398 family)